MALGGGPRGPATGLCSLPVTTKPGGAEQKSLAQTAVLYQAGDNQGPKASLEDQQVTGTDQIPSRK